MAVVILDSDQVPEGISRKFVRFPGEQQDHFYGRVTHLHHQNQKICQIGDLSSVRNLTVLYLYDNRIQKIEHLDAVPNLQMLYLQKNRISVIENLSHLKKLKKLYLSNNKISVVEGLQDLRGLHELHVDHQQLSTDQNVVFDPRSCAGLKNLRVLNTAKNQMVDLQPLELFPRLSMLDIGHNLLSDVQAVIDSLVRIPSLQKLDLRGNPLTSTLRYRENVIGACVQLSTIDGKTVETRSRTMMRNLRNMRQKSTGSSSSNSTSSSAASSNAPLLNLNDTNME